MKKRYTTQGKNCGGRIKGYASGGVVTDPDSDQYDPGRSGPAYSKGSRGALDEAINYHSKVDEMRDPSRNRGQGPTRARARGDRS